MSNKAEKTSEQILAEGDVEEIFGQAELRYRWHDAVPATSHDVRPLEDILKAVLEVLTPEQRKKVLEKVHYRG